MVKACVLKVQDKCVALRIMNNIPLGTLNSIRSRVNSFKGTLFEIDFMWVVRAVEDAREWPFESAALE